MCCFFLCKIFKMQKCDADALKMKLQRFVTVCEEKRRQHLGSSCHVELQHPFPVLLLHGRILDGLHLVKVG